jgi:hypothetical protein
MQVALMQTSSPPPPPDPVATANAQGAANTKAATTQQMVNMVDQVTPYGNLTYEKKPNWEGTDAPHFTATTTLSPEEQNKQKQQWEFDSLVNNLGIDQTKRLTGHLDKPITLGNEATESRLMDLGRKRLDPMFAQKRDALHTQLRNQGFNPGDEGYDRAMASFGEQENDAYNNLLLTGRGTANQELLTERNQPINEITALMSGGQVTQPNFTSTPTASVAAPDIAGLTMDAYRMGPLEGWKAQNASKQAMMGGLFSLGGAALGGWGRSGFKMA